MLKYLKADVERAMLHAYYHHVMNCDAVVIDCPGHGSDWPAVSGGPCWLCPTISRHRPSRKQPS